MLEYKEGYIICENNIKMDILNQLNENSEFKDYTFLTLKELKKKLSFSVKKEAFLEVVKEYRVNPEVAVGYIKSLESLNGNYETSKGEFLYNLKQMLERRGMLEYDNLFKNHLTKRHFTFLNYFKNKELEYILSFFTSDNYSIYEPIDTLNLVHYSIDIFQDIESEIQYIFKQIYDLYLNGVNLNDIKICNANDDYNFIINRYQYYYNIRLGHKSNKNILSTKLANDILSLCDLDKTPSEMVEILKEEYESSHLFRSFVDMINNYSLYNYSMKQNKGSIELLLKKLSYKTEKSTSFVELIDINELSSNKDKYIFLVNFNIDIPNVKKDEDFLLDKDKIKMNLDPSFVINLETKAQLLTTLKGINNLKLSFSYLHSFKKETISPLVLELNMDKVNHSKTSYVFGYEETNDMLYLSKACDNLLKFNEKNELLDKYYYGGISYNTFDNTFKGLDKAKLNNYLNGKLTLSYSDMHTYLKCPFSYYANKILKLNEFKSTLDANLGTFAHNVLEDFELQKEAFNFDESVRKHKNMISAELDVRDSFYIDKMANHLKLVIEEIKAHKENTSLNDVYCEKQMDVGLHEGKLLFKGFIDKLWYKEIDNVLYVAIIDYKTGSDKASLENILYGENLQLPVYIYLLRNNKKFMNSKLVGFYLQKINIILPKSSDGSKEEQNLKNLKLEGYTKKEYANLIDITEGSFLKKYKLNKDGSPSSNSLVFDDAKEKELIDIVSKHIEETYQSIINADFRIEPKVINKTNVSCTYCGFRDICFKTPKDYKYINTKEETNNEDE